MDLTPPVHGGPVVLFFIDPVRVYEGFNIPTVHYPYNTSSICQDYVEVCDEINRLMLPPGNAGQNHQIPHDQMEALNARRREIFSRAKRSTC